MSHLATVEISIMDMQALKQACTRLGLELREGQTTYRSYGNAQNPCVHAICVPGSQQAYEVGVVKNLDAKGFTLSLDEWSGGKGLIKKTGKGCCKIKQHYAACAATRQAKKQGFRVREMVRTDGSIQLIASK